MQLVAYGAQDIYLTGNPMITYFKMVYRRHTNFAMECIQQTIAGNVGFGNKIKALISRNGDLVSGMYLEATLPHVTATAANTRWVDSVGHYLIRSVDIEIGGQIIDRHYSDWLEIWAQLTVPASKKSGYYEMIGLDGTNYGLQQNAGLNTILRPGANTNVDGNRILYIPLQFWFCRNVGLALPLIALQYHEVSVCIQFETLSNLVIGNHTVSDVLKADLWVDYIYLDSDERRRFAQVSHEYLIEQLQHENTDYTSDKIDVIITLNHPVKELIWVARKTTNAEAKQWSNYTNVTATLTTVNSHVRADTIDADLTSDSASDISTYRRSLASNMIQSAKLRLNGNDRFETMPGMFFNTIQTLRHHTSKPNSPGINVYSFALKPEDHQPSGTCNFSRIDNAKLVLTLNPDPSDVDGVAEGQGGSIKLYAVNYNVLRIMSGMGGVAYSN